MFPALPVLWALPPVPAALFPRLLLPLLPATAAPGPLPPLLSSCPTQWPAAVGRGSAPEQKQAVGRHRPPPPQTAAGPPCTAPRGRSGPQSARCPGSALPAGQNLPWQIQTLPPPRASAGQPLSRPGAGPPARPRHRFWHFPPRPADRPASASGCLPRRTRCPARPRHSPHGPPLPAGGSGRWGRPVRYRSL